MEDRVDERLVTKPSAEAKVFTDQEDLCENERIDNRKGMLLIIQMALRKDETRMERQKPNTIHR